MQEELPLKASPSNVSEDHLVQTYGDLVYDLCASLLIGPEAQIAFRSIFRKIRSMSRFQKYLKYERSWVLKIACEKLISLCHQQNHHLTLEEQIQLDATASTPARLKNFSAYFRRLVPEDQLLLLLRDKQGIPYSEISVAMAVPEGSLKIRRQQALRSLEEWVWDRR